MIYIQVLDRYWDAGKKIAEKKGWTDDQKFRFQRYLANQYKDLVVKAINDQRYRNRWVSLTIGYLNYKKKHGYSTGMWELTGELKNSIKVTSRRNKIIEIGFPNKKHDGTSLKLVELAKILEFGNIRIPPRPLFRLIYRYMSSNTDFFLKKYESLERK